MSPVGMVSIQEVADIAVVPTARERFCAVLFNQPRTFGDAIVVPSGDGVERYATAVELLRIGGGPFIVLTGGLDNPPHSLTAEKAKAHVMGLGVHPDRIMLDGSAMNTREQAVNTVALAKQERWQTVLLVVSPYHAPRAFLTFVKALDDADGLSSLRFVLVPTAHTPWFGNPAGKDATRIELLADEFRKIEEYQASGDCADYEGGLDYLKRWEAK